MSSPPHYILHRAVPTREAPNGYSWGTSAQSTKPLAKNRKIVTSTHSNAGLLMSMPLPLHLHEM